MRYTLTESSAIKINLHACLQASCTMPRVLNICSLLVGAAATGEGSRGGVGGSLNHDGVSTDTGYSVT